jgi:glycosyltransferase involved in cell wall biosynthesis
MATYNGANYIKEQLDSFLSQTRLPDELVVTDDCSTDNTREILIEFAAISPFPVRIEVNNQQIGYAQNFNNALSLATGDLVFLSDQDDRWFPEKIERMAELARQNADTGCFINDAVLADGQLKSDGKTKMTQIRGLGLPDHTMVMGCCMAVTRPFLTFALPIPYKFHSHDVWLAGVADRLGCILRRDWPLQLYRRHAENLSNLPINQIGRPTWWLRLEQMVSKLKNYSSDHSLIQELEFYRALESRIHESSFGYNQATRSQISILASGVFEETTLRLMVLDRRYKLRGLTIPERTQEIASLWRAGAYDYPKGSLVALKDLLVSLTQRKGFSSHEKG